MEDVKNRNNTKNNCTGLIDFILIPFTVNDKLTKILHFIIENNDNDVKLVKF